MLRDHPCPMKRSATQALETVASLLAEALVNIRGEGTPSGMKGYSFKEFDEHPFTVFSGDLNFKEVKD
jgi:hypothetical protein